MTEPTTNPTTRTTAPRVAGPRDLDHNNECVGCGAHLADPCHPTCPFETGILAPPVLLRAAAKRLRDNPAGVGYDVADALFTAALDLVGETEAAGACDQARRILTSHLVDQLGAAATRTEVAYRLNLPTDLPEIALALYAAAARHDGIDFDPDSFGDFPA